jgi:hypothetical protein
MTGELPIQITPADRLLTAADFIGWRTVARFVARFDLRRQFALDLGDLGRHALAVFSIWGSRAGFAHCRWRRSLGPPAGPALTGSRMRDMGARFP